MIWSPGRKYLFIHIPKTGGTSMALALEARAMKDDVMLGDTPKAAKRRRRLKDVRAAGRLWKHSTLADLDGLVPRGDLDDLFVFTMVRNPWARVVSYYQWLRGQTFAHPAVQIARAENFAGFVQHPQIVHSLRSSPAVSYVRDYAGRDRCRAFIRLEHFAEDAAPLFAHLGFSLELPHVNRSADGVDWRQHYTDQLVDQVGAICAEDVDRFGYTF